MSTLYIDRRGIEIGLNGECLVFRENGQKISSIPIAPLKRIFIKGNNQIETRVLSKLGEKNVNVTILSTSKFTPSLLLTTPHQDASRRINHYKKSLDPNWCMAISRKLVTDKITAQTQLLAALAERSLLYRFDLMKTCEQLRDITTKVADTEEINSLRGLEGSAAREYFSALTLVLPDSLQFSGRNRRPPKDPFNVVLSLGYTMLLTEAICLLYSHGLDPYVGIYHCLDFGRPSLACDLIEPLRPSIDEFSIQLFKNKTLRVEHFTSSDDGCLFGKAGRAIYYPAYDAVAESFRKSIEKYCTYLIHALGGTN